MNLNDLARSIDRYGSYFVTLAAAERMARKGEWILAVSGGFVTGRPRLIDAAAVAGIGKIVGFGK